MLNGRVACGTLSILLIVGASQPGRAHTTQQWTPDKPGSDNIEVVAHLPLGPRLRVADIEIEQERGVVFRSRRPECVASFGHEVNLVRIETKREEFTHPVVGHCATRARPAAE